MLVWWADLNVSGFDAELNLHARLRIHGLKHIGPSILLARGIDEGVVRKITGHRSRELWRYQHLMPQLRETTVNIVASELLGTKE